MEMADGAPSDELARTATAPGTSGDKEAAPPLGDTLGRYRLERALGEGGMGVVHAAFDPDLERRVALKVLRTTDVSGEARQRLLREARAMARLTHPNVVTVHEVGSANGRDYVAMELVEGETLADWLRAKPRTRAEILDVFRAAGRGLAAAHAAGLVHRDFKPHNVLRRRDGRICVTDFGLARGIDAGTPATGLEATMRMNTADVNSSSLTGITATGSVLGTPAYMAPEQWSNGTVGPHADQFAYCVALWEAIAGERPFRGDTIDELKKQVRRGPKKADAAKLPRGLRRALVRGLDPDPDERWPDMDALLAQIDRGQRRPFALVGAGAAVAVAAALYLLLARGSGDDCARPLLDPNKVWSPARAAQLAGDHQKFGAESLAADFARWQDVRGSACHGEPSARVAKLACLDAVLAGIDAHARALEHVSAPNADVGALSVEPKVCDAARPPRLIAAFSDARVDAIAAMLDRTVSEDRLEPAAADKLIARAADDPCAATIAHLVAMAAHRTESELKRELDDAEGAAQRCGDDRLIAEAAFNIAATAVNDREPDFAAKMKRAEAAAQIVMQPDLQAAFDGLYASIAQRSDRLDEAIARTTSARDGYAARGRLRAELREELSLEGLREIRARPEDLAQITGQLETWRRRAVDRLGLDDVVVRDIDRAIANWDLANGDVGAFHSRAIAATKPTPLEHKVAVHGRVLDEQGQPAAGATVYAGPDVNADSVGILPGGEMRSAKTGADGTFELPEAVADGLIIAERGDMRSSAAKIGEHVELKLAPTSRVEGHVDLRGRAPTTVLIFAHDPSQMMQGLAVIAPVHADGSFSLDGVPRGKITLHAQVARAATSALTGTQVTVDAPIVKDVQISVGASKRTVYVIVRSTAGISLTRGQVLVLPGKQSPPNAAVLLQTMQDVQEREALPIEGEHAPKSVLERAKPGDIYAVVPEAPEQLASACAIGLPSEINDPELEKKIIAHLDRIELRCVPIGEKDEVVVVEVPPWPRLDD